MVKIMNNVSVAILKILLGSLSTVAILLSAFLIALCFDMWVNSGIPPFENLKFSIFLFFVILLIVIICQCLKFHLFISIDNRNIKSVNNLNSN